MVWVFLNWFEINMITCKNSFSLKIRTSHLFKALQHKTYLTENIYQLLYKICQVF